MHVTLKYRPDFLLINTPAAEVPGGPREKVVGRHLFETLRGPSVPQRTSTFTLRGRGPSVPGTPAFVVVMAAAKQDAAMLFVVVTAHSFSFFLYSHLSSYYLTHF